MRVLIFMASPHKASNTGIMVEEFLHAFHEGDYKIINVYDEHVAPCMDCGFCRQSHGSCSIKDNMRRIYDEISISDAIVVASPMYFSSFPGPMKNIIDRCQVYWDMDNKTKETLNIYHKKGILLLNAGTSWDNMFIHMESMGRYFFKTVGASLTGSVYVPSTDKISLKNNTEIILQIRKLSENLYDLLKNNK